MSDVTDWRPAGTAGPGSEPPAAPQLAEAYPELFAQYLAVWALAHSGRVGVRARRIARRWLDRMTLVLEAELPGVPAGAGTYFSRRRDRPAEGRDAA